MSWQPLPIRPAIQWLPWPGHAAVSRPPCTGAPGCRGEASSWVRCACGEPFAACGDHRRDLLAERETHRKRCGCS